MRIITIAGKARHGKDFVAKLLKPRLEREGAKVLIARYGDLLKYVMRTFFDWDGKKDEKGRSKLQYVGTEVIRTQRPDYWVEFLIGILEMFPDEWDYVIIPDARFENEIDCFKEKGFDIVSLLVDRPNFDNGLTDEQKAHISETGLDDYDFDYILSNPGDASIINEIGAFLRYTKWMYDGLPLGYRYKTALLEDEFLEDYRKAKEEGSAENKV